VVASGGAEEVEPDLRGGATILVVDDELVVRKAARSALTRYGYTVLLAANGSEGVEIFRREADRISLMA
jgi:CheY-like chemotaxis protein